VCEVHAGNTQLEVCLMIYCGTEQDSGRYALIVQACCFFRDDVLQKTLLNFLFQFSTAMPDALTDLSL
jgi:hypothetical protein